MADKFQWFNGIKFTRDDSTGYYLNSTIRKRMHIYVWEFYNGKVPKGFEIHHKDFDRSNNDISNLQLLSKSEHRKLHAQLLTGEQRQWKRDNFNAKARPKAIEWHKSAEGKQWHKEQYQKCADRLHQTIEKHCIQCGKVYLGESKSKFCSNACKSTYRRVQGTDLVETICVYCGKSFMTNKFRVAKTCSRSCANKYRWIVKNESKVSEKNN